MVRIPALNKRLGEIAGRDSVAVKDRIIENNG